MLAPCPSSSSFKPPPRLPALTPAEMGCRWAVWVGICHHQCVTWWKWGQASLCSRWARRTVSTLSLVAFYGWSSAPEVPVVPCVAFGVVHRSRGSPCSVSKAPLSYIFVWTVLCYQRYLYPKCKNDAILNFSLHTLYLAGLNPMSRAPQCSGPGTSANQGVRGWSRPWCGAEAERPRREASGGMRCACAERR